MSTVSSAGKFILEADIKKEDLVHILNKRYIENYTILNVSMQGDGSYAVVFKKRERNKF